MIQADLDHLTEIVRIAAREELLPRFASVTRHLKTDGSIVTVADEAVQHRLESALAQRWPDYPLLGEEMTAKRQAELIQDPGQGLWILDPLDGTSNFASGIPYFSVSLALLQKGRVALGVVYDPSRDECFTAVRGEGATLNGEPLRPGGAPPDLKRCIAAVDFKRLDRDLATRLSVAPPYSSQRSFGSVALDWCWLASGRFHVYLHGRQKLWDYAAGALVLGEAGGFGATLAGEPVFAPSTTARSAVAALEGSLFNEWWIWLSGGKALPVTGLD